jgi:hypothetical protein
MGQRIIRALIFTCIALFGLRGVLPDIANRYGSTTLFLPALVIIPIAGTVAYQIISGALRKRKERKQHIEEHSASA